MEALDARSDLDEADTEGNAEIGDATKLSPFDIGTLCGSPTTNQLEDIIRAGPAPFPKQFPRDADGQQFPISVLLCNHENGEKVKENGWCLVLLRKLCIAFHVDYFPT